jgi:hypothetical protein
MVFLINRSARSPLCPLFGFLRSAELTESGGRQLCC